MNSKRLGCERRATAIRLSVMPDMFVSLTLIATARRSPLHGENPALTISFVYTTQSCSWRKNNLNTTT